MIDDLKDLLRLPWNLGLNKKLFPRQPLHCAAQPFESAIGLRTIEIRDSLVVGIFYQVIEPFAAKVKLHLATVTAGAHAQAAELDARLSKCDLVHRGAFGRRGRKRASAQHHSAGGGEGGLQEFA